MRFDLGVDLLQTRGIAVALAQARRPAAVAEAVDLLQERAVGAAAEARVLLVDQAEREQLRRLELGRELRLPRLRRRARARLRAMRIDLETAVLEVVRLLGVEREDAVRERLIRRDQSGDLTQSEELRRGQAMAAVRRPQPAVLAAHDDQRIEERAGLVDAIGQAAGVRGREVALERRRLNGCEGQRRQQERTAGERLAIGPIAAPPACSTSAVIAAMSGSSRPSTISDAASPRASLRGASLPRARFPAGFREPVFLPDDFAGGAMRNRFSALIAYIPCPGGHACR